MPKQIAFVTCLNNPKLSNSDALMVQPLQELGVEVTPVPWQSKDIQWNGFDMVVIRSTWDYYNNTESFLNWVQELEAAHVVMLNPAQVIRWNIDKAYLQSLAEQGCAVTPTVYIPKGRAVSLREVLEKNQWTELIIKPAVGASAYSVSKGDFSSLAECQKSATQILNNSGLLIQKYLKEICEFGELSLIFLEGEFSHAALKKPKPGDFRANVDCGGSITGYAVPEDIVHQAQMVLKKAIPGLLYSRVDGTIVDGRFIVSEIELIEPSLYLYTDPKAPSRFAKCIWRRLGAGSIFA